MNLLVKKARKHDKAAFQQLMQQEGSSMYKIARAILKNDEDVADAMQETALACWEKIHTLKKDKYFKTWMVRILINNCNAICRQRTRTVSGETIPAYNQLYLNDINNIRLDGFICKPPVYRTTPFNREIADILQLNENTVRGRLATARCKLEAQYRDQLRQAAPKDHSVTMQTER